MADLFDRLTTNPDDESPIISGHYLISALTSYYFGQDTDTQIKTFFNMDIDAQSDFDTLTTHLDGLASDLAKVGFLRRFEAAISRIELGITTTKQQFTDYLGIT